MQNIKHNTLTLTFVLLLTACGGGSSDSNTPTPTASPIPSTTPSPKAENSSNTLTVNATPTPALASSPTPSSTPILETQVQENIPELPTTGSSTQRVTDEVKEETNNQNNLPTAHAGTDTSTTVNKTITLTGTVSNVGTQTIFYEWKKGISILATTASVDYTPKEEDSLPTAGARVDTLTFSISNKNGLLDSDQINITVNP